jgi:DNA repair and recombination protein RAD54B
LTNYYCRRKFTTKKHETWDGDGVLTVINGYAHLQDVSGRDLGKIAWKSPLLPGSTLSIGGKDVEIDSVISKADYLAGKPFLNSQVIDRVSAETQASSKRPPTPIFRNEKSLIRDLPPVSLRAVMNKSSTAAFRNPLSKSSKPASSASLRQPVPRHDPMVPGALVLPRPETAPKGKQIVDIVVDPILSRHLREHQREGVKFLYECVMGMRLTDGQGAVLADEMGLGKTLQTITLIWTLLKQNPIYEAPPVVNKVLIVCPVTLINNWRKEIRKWLGKDRVGVYVGDKHSKITDFTLGRAYNVMVVGYEKLRTIQDDLKRGGGIDLIVVDEGHKLKTAQNKAALAIKSFGTDRIIVLTGTPMQNNLSEYHTMVDMVNPGILSKYNTFKREFETPIVKSRQPGASQKDREKGEARSEELASLTSQFILRRTSEVIAQYLPPKTESVLFCRPTTHQIMVYKSVLESPLYGSLLRSSESSLQLINILKRLCNSLELLDSGGGASNETILTLLRSTTSKTSRRGSAVSTKLAFLELLLQKISESEDEKVVLVSNYTSTLDLIEKLLTAKSYSYLRLDGQTPTAKRQDLVDCFNNSPVDKSFAFLLSAKAGGMGLNLVGASRLVLFDVDWNPATDLQAMARIHRDGQKKPCFIYRLVVQGTLEEKIYQRQITKTGLSDAVVDAKKTSQGFTSEELRDLFRLEEGDSCPTHDLLGCECEGLGNTRVLPESSSEYEVHRPWGVTMGDPAADELSDAENEEASSLGVLISASKVNRALQEKKIQEENHKNDEDKIMALMQYLHINAARIQGGDVELESLVEDRSLLEVLQDERSPVAFMFAKTSG